MSNYTTLHCYEYEQYTDVDVDAVQVLNLFLALLLSSFGTQSLQSRNNGANNNNGNGGGGDEAPNKLMEAIDRIRRWTAYVRSRSRFCPLLPSRRTVDGNHQPPLLGDSHSLPDIGQSYAASNKKLSRCCDHGRPQADQRASAKLLDLVVFFCLSTLH